MGNTDLRQREAILDYERAKATIKADNGTSLRSDERICY